MKIRAPIARGRLFPARLLLPLLLAGILLLGACVPRRPPLPPVPPEIGAELLQRIDAQPVFHALQGMARVRLISEGHSQSSSQVLLAQSPDRFRSEVLSPFGQPLLVIAADGHELRVLVPGEARLYRGAATVENLVRFTSLPLGFDVLVPILLYRPPIMPYDDWLIDHGVRGGYRLTLFHQGGYRQELDFDRELRLTGVVYHLAEEPLLRVGYDRFADHGGHPFPQQIFLEAPGESEVLLNFSDLRTNTDIPPERFRLPAPPGTETLPFP